MKKDELEYKINLLKKCKEQIDSNNPIDLMCDRKYNIRNTDIIYLIIDLILELYDEKK